MTYNRRHFLTILASTIVAPQFALASAHWISLRPQE